MYKRAFKFETIFCRKKFSVSTLYGVSFNNKFEKYIVEFDQIVLSVSLRQSKIVYCMYARDDDFLTKTKRNKRK